jgi:hypothetical protein
MIHIDQDNYFDKIKGLSAEQFNLLPQDLREEHEFIKEATGNGKTWQAYQQDDAIREVMTDHFTRLADFIEKTSKQKKVQQEKPETKPKPQVTKSPAKSQTPKKQIPLDVPNKGTALVERIPEEIRFIKRFVNLNDRVKTRDQILSFLSALQKSIVEKRIRKASPYVKEIEYIQERLIDLYHHIKSNVEIIISPKRLQSLKEICDSQKIIPSVPFIKRYINLSGKPGMKKKAADLMKQIKNAIEKDKVSSSDPYYTRLTGIMSGLQAFIKKTDQKVMQISKSELNGLQGILGCACSPSLNGIDEERPLDIGNSDEPRIMNSMDFAKVEFSTIGLQGKWRELIGDPAPGFTAMVFGKPKMGKSYLCVEFAGYLARHHGKVLYVAKEEGLDATLQIKTKDKDVAHPNLTISDGLPKDLSPYDYVFLDSVTKLRMTPEDLERLEKENPGKSFIYIFQTTKLGIFRGANAFQHEVDAVIEVPEKGIAVQNGRFNQGGQISIFGDQPIKNQAA